MVTGSNNNNLRTFLAKLKVVSMFLVTVNAVEASKSFTIKCNDCSLYSSSVGPDNVLHRDGRQVAPYTSNEFDNVYSSIKNTLYDSHLMTKHRSGVNYKTTSSDKYSLEPHSKEGRKVRNKRLNHIGKFHTKSAEKYSQVKQPHSIVKYGSTTRQLQPLDPQFGAFYFQRKLWYVPLYFSVGFAVYLWSLIIKSLSRHRVYFPPPGPPPPPPPPPIAAIG